MLVDVISPLIGEFLLTAIAQNLRRLALTFPSRLTEAIPAPA